MNLKIERAIPSHAQLLSKLAFRSKAYWGYSDDFMRACEDELSYSEKELSDHYAYVLKTNNQIIGFYILKQLSEQIAELDALFVDANQIGEGHGRKLIEHAKSCARSLTVSKIIIQGDPNAMRFYCSAGAIQTGEKESQSIQGRYLPMFEIDLDEQKSKS